MPKTVTSPTETVGSLGKIKQTVVKFTFAPNGSSAIDQTTVKGWASSVTYVSTGLYRVNFPENFPAQVLDAAARCRFAAKDGRIIEVGTVSNGTSTTGAHMFIRAMTVGTTTLADIAADANNIMSGEIWFANTGVTR